MFFNELKQRYKIDDKLLNAYVHFLFLTESLPYKVKVWGMTCVIVVFTRQRGLEERY